MDNQGTKGKSEKKAENVASKPLDLTDQGQVDTEGSDQYYAKRETGGIEVWSGTNVSGDTERTWGSYLPCIQTGDESAQFWANRLVAAGGGFTDDPVASWR